MSQSFAEIVRNDKNLLALLKIGAHRTSSIENVNLTVDDVAGICVKILAIETKNPKNYSRRIAWTIIGCLLVNLTTHYDIQVAILFDDCQRYKQSLTRQSLIFNCGQATKRKANTKQVAKQARGGKKRRTANNNDDDDGDDVEKNDRTTFFGERFWEVPLTLETNINLKNDPCLVPAEQITLRECDFDESSQIDETMEEQLINYGFGDTDQVFPFDDQPMVNVSSAVDENMNNIMDIAMDLDMPNISNASDVSDMQPIQSAHVDTTQKSKEQSTHVIDENGNENTKALLDELSLVPSSIGVQKKKNATKRRRTTLLLDEEKIIPSKIMRARTSNVFVGCKNLKDYRIQLSNQFKQQKTSFSFIEPAMKGLYNGELFASHAKTRPMPVDWTIINDVFNASERGDDDSQTSDILQSEHGSQFNRTRNQSRMSFSELPSLDSSLMPPPPPITSTPKQPRLYDRSSRATSPSNATNVFTPPSAFKNSEQNFTPPTAFKNSEQNLTPPSAFKNSEQNSNLPSQTVPPPIEYGDDDDGINVCSNQSNTDQQSGFQNRSSFQRTNDQTTTKTMATTMDEEIEESEGDPIEHTDLMTILAKDSFEYAIITKLIQLWQKDTHPIEVGHLLKKGCNRIQAAKTFSSLLILKKKELIQMDSANDGQITHISAGSKMSLPE